MTVQQLAKDLQQMTAEKKKVDFQLNAVANDTETKADAIIRTNDNLGAVKVLKASIKDKQKEINKKIASIDSKRAYFENLPKTLYPKVFAFSETALNSLNACIATIEEAYQTILPDLQEHREHRHDLAYDLDLNSSTEIPGLIPVPGVKLYKINEIKSQLVEGLKLEILDMLHFKAKQIRVKEKMEDR